MFRGSCNILVDGSMCDVMAVCVSATLGRRPGPVTANGVVCICTASQYFLLQGQSEMGGGS